MRDNGILVSLQVGMPTVVEDASGQWATGIFKTPVQEPLWLGRENLEGDGQADLTVHGGPERAVLAYAAEHFPLWRKELAHPDLPYGAFGENFTVDGLTEEDVAIGDTYRVGEAQVQVSQPRGPCWKLARKWGLPDLPARVLKTNRTGWYLRVLEEGRIEPGAAMTLLERPFPEWTIARVNLVAYRRPRHPGEAARLARCPLLASDSLEPRRRGGGAPRL